MLDRDMKKLHLRLLLLVLSLVFLLSACSGASPTDVGGTSEVMTQADTEKTTAAIEGDPYAGVSRSEFYADYEPADSYWDAYYRTLHGFMSGEISEQDQAPTVSEYQPREQGMLLRNSAALYSDGGKTYSVLNAYGDVVNVIYKSGAYVTLEEVAAYIFAFGDIPPNYVESKGKDPATSKWGEYLRLNHTKFSGNTKKYPYEPVLPDISGCGGSLTYYEVDIGTTGTDCDPKYRAEVYNNGERIERGAARIVYTRYDKNGDAIIDINEKYLFYTFNHYNDFQEYLNYEGGWGEIFGNITGGGSISSKTDYNPTPYVKVVMRDFTYIADAASARYDFAAVLFPIKFYSLTEA